MSTSKQAQATDRSGQQARESIVTLDADAHEALVSRLYRVAGQARMMYDLALASLDAENPRKTVEMDADAMTEVFDGIACELKSVATELGNCNLQTKPAREGASPLQ